MHRVFVYGTLKRGFCNHYLLENQKFLGTTRTAPQFDIFAFDKSNPFPIMTEGTERVSGEVYEVDDTAIKRLDVLESEGRLYHRVVIDTENFGKCSAYLFRHPHGRHRVGIHRNEDGSLRWEIV